MVVEAGSHDSYNVRVDGSGRLSKRNRTHLKPVQALDDAPFLPLASPSLFEDTAARPRAEPAQDPPPEPPRAQPPPPPPDDAAPSETGHDRSDPVTEAVPAGPPPREELPPAPLPTPRTPPRAPPPPPPTDERRYPVRRNRGVPPQRLVELCALAYKEGDHDLGDELLDCVAGLWRFQ